MKANFKVSGMDCASCAATIKKAVGKVAGVSGVDVSFASGKMAVDYDPRAASPTQIREAVKKAGYDTAV
jgi:Cu+-exporting ATPase